MPLSLCLLMFDCVHLPLHVSARDFLCLLLFADVLYVLRCFCFVCYCLLFLLLQTMFFVFDCVCVFFRLLVRACVYLYLHVRACDLLSSMCASFGLCFGLIVFANSFWLLAAVRVCICFCVCECVCFCLCVYVFASGWSVACAWLCLSLFDSIYERFYV